MNINVKPSDCVYYVNEEARKVVCVIPHTEEVFFDYIENFPFWITKEKLYDSLIMPSRFVGIATCSPEDEFNEELGKRIAFHKAKGKMNASFFKRAQTYINSIDKDFVEVIENFNNYGERLSNNADRREKIIESMVNKEGKE